MKLAIPIENRNGLDSKVAEHFGRCSSFAILDEEGKIIELIENTSRHTGGKGLPPDMLKAKGVAILLCKSLGPKAISLCQDFGIKVYLSPAETVRELFFTWKDKKIKKALVEDGCRDHKH